MGGVEAITRVMASNGHPPRFIVLTTFDLDDTTVPRRGCRCASGFLLKSTDPEFLLAAIRTVHAGSAVLAPSATVKSGAPVRRPSVSRRTDGHDVLECAHPS